MSNEHNPQIRTTTGVSMYLGGATITAAAALWQLEARATVMLPLMAILLLLSYQVKFRIERSSIRIASRVVLYLVVLTLYRIRPPNYDITLFDPFVLNQCADLCMAEVVIRAWSRYHSLRYNRALVLLPIGIMFVVSTNTYSDSIGRYFTPVFMVLLTLGIQSMRAPASPGAAKRARAGVAIAISSAALFGAILYHALFVNRDALTDWAYHVLNSSNLPSANGLSDESRLGSVFGRSGSYDRVLRIHPTADVSYMRAFSMYTYNGRSWGPETRNINRHFEPINENELLTNYEGTHTQVYRYLDSIGLILAPLNTISIGIDGATHLMWAKADGGPLKFDRPGPDSYNMTIGVPDQQGLLCEAPTPAQLKQLLQVPGDIDSRTKGLAETITAGISDPLKKAHAIEAWLPGHHAYSQHIRVNSKDPLGDFLFSNKAAHCEFFASAAVILMRCAGVPSRYVIGYYAHEEEGGDIVVRQRDAHAWAECWIKGPGWVTIDATPGSGRPSGDINSVPAWKHSLERLQDWFAGVRQNLTPQNMMKVAGLFICLALSAYLLQNRYHFAWRRVRKAPVREYTAASEELRRLYARFETVCRKCGLVCPPNISWQTYLSAEQHALASGGGAEQSTETINAAAEIVNAYDLARFGRGLNSDAYRVLNSKLDVMERVAKRVVTEEKRI